MRAAGRILLLRRQGKLTFATIRDGSGEVRLFVARGGPGGDTGQSEVDRVVMADPDSNEFCVLRSA